MLSVRARARVHTGVSLPYWTDEAGGLRPGGVPHDILACCFVRVHVLLYGVHRNSCPIDSTTVVAGRSPMTRPDVEPFGVQLRQQGVFADSNWHENEGEQKL